MIICQTDLPFGSESNLWSYKGIEPTSQNASITQCRTSIIQYITYFKDSTKIPYVYLLIGQFRKLKIESAMDKISRAIRTIVLSWIHNSQSKINLLHLGPNIFRIIPRHPRLFLRHQRLKHPTFLSTQLIMIWIVSIFLDWK